MVIVPCSFQDLLKESDKDKDGKISWEEFKNTLSAKA